ncbi:MAG: electron transport complex subunit RsxD [Gammaproteobacteria bacterium]|nr:electron transport complex subunit RsxD [Gammaproteobacteria bacterium]
MSKVASSPYLDGGYSLRGVMLQVLLALVPAYLVYVWQFGPGILITTLLAMTTGLAAEALMLRVRQRPLWPFLSDGSVLVTAALLTLALPPLVPWWVVVIGTLFAVVVAKQLYGGLGYNPFNPAMAGYVVLLISFPLELTRWSAPQSLLADPVGLVDSLNMIFGVGGTAPVLALDALTMATPLDQMKVQIPLLGSVEAALASSPVFGAIGGQGGEWVVGAYLLGGLYLLWRRVINWHIPVALLVGLGLMAGLFHLLDAARYPDPLFHLFSGAAMIGAFFIATDPVSAATSNRGRLIYGAGIGVMIYLIRTWGGYPDGVAFAVLLMNMLVPLIDYYTPPRVYGHSS